MSLSSLQWPFKVVALEWVRIHHIIPQFIKDKKYGHDIYEKDFKTNVKLNKDEVTQLLKIQKNYAMIQPVTITPFVQTVKVLRYSVTVLIPQYLHISLITYN
jgi:hypothetical protein